MGGEVISMIRILLAKGTAFCVYRFPKQNQICLALPIELLPDKAANSFWFAPFTVQSDAKEIILGVVDNEFLNERFIEHLKALPDQKILENDLPEETTKETYFRQFEEIQDHISNKRISKSILSRVIKEKLPVDFDVVNCFTTLCADYNDAFVHLLYHPDAGIWLGATPELLIDKRDKELKIMAVAGTQAKHNGSVYNWRQKEMDEHNMVGFHIEQVFNRYGCVQTYKSRPYTIEAGRVVHLRTDYKYIEHTSIPLKEFIFAIHPTPAIGGLPVEASIEVIHSVEEYDRRYYCGFLGETDFVTNALLYVNLRCMQIGHSEIAIYVGGGITAESDVHEEWEETVMKSKTMIEKLKSVQVLN